MRAVGIDSSLTCTGVAVAGEPVEVLTFPTKPHTSGDLVQLRERIRYITGKALQAAPQRCLTVIEAPYLPRHGGGAVMERIGLWWYLVDQFLGRGPVAMVTARTRAKYAADSGNATKPQVLAAMRGRFPQLTIRDDNAADALALAAMGARFLGSPIDGEPSKQQLEAMDAVRWQANPKE